MTPRRLNPVITGNESNFKDFRAKVINEADPKGLSAPASANGLLQGSIPRESISQSKETDSGFHLVPPNQLINSLPERAVEPVSAERAAKPPITPVN